MSIARTFISRVLRRRRRGFSLIDVLAGMVILTFALGSAFELAYLNARTMERNQNLAAASLLAESKMEELRNLTYAAVSSGSDTGTLNPQGTPGGIFTRAWTVTTDSPAVGLKTVTVNVNWTQMGGTQQYAVNGVVSQ